MDVSITQHPTGAGMDVLSFISSLAGSLAWPLIVLTVILMFRSQIIALADKLTGFEGFGVKLNFAQRVAALAAAAHTAPVRRLGGETLTKLADELKVGAAPMSFFAPGTAEPNVAAPAPHASGTAEGKVLTGWLMIEGALREVAQARGLHPEKKPRANLTARLRGKPLSEETVALINDAQFLRNAVVNGQATALNLATAQQYVATAQQIVERIRTEAGAG